MPMFLFPSEFTCPSKTSFPYFCHSIISNLNSFCPNIPFPYLQPRKSWSVLLLQPEPTTDFPCCVPMQVGQAHSKGITLPWSSVGLRLLAAHSLRPKCDKTIHVFLSVPRGMTYLTVVDFQSLKFKSCIKGFFPLRYAMFSEKIIQGSEYIISGEILGCFYSIWFDHWFLKSWSSSAGCCQSQWCQVAMQT